MKNLIFLIIGVFFAAGFLIFFTIYFLSGHPVDACLMLFSGVLTILSFSFIKD